MVVTLSGSSSAHNYEHSSLKSDIPIFVTLSGGISMSRNDSQHIKVLSSMVVIPFGITIDCNDVPLKASHPMAVTLFGNPKIAYDSHHLFLNAISPMVVTLFGISTDSNDVLLPSKALYPILIIAAPSPT